MWSDIQLFNGRAIVEIFVTIKNSIQNCQKKVDCQNIANNKKLFATSVQSGGFEAGNERQGRSQCYVCSTYVRRNVWQVCAQLPLVTMAKHHSRIKKLEAHFIKLMTDDVDNSMQRRNFDVIRPKK